MIQSKNAISNKLRQLITFLAVLILVIVTAKKSLAQERTITVSPSVAYCETNVYFNPNIPLLYLPPTHKIKMTCESGGCMTSAPVILPYDDPKVVQFNISNTCATGTAATGGVYRVELIDGSDVVVATADRTITLASAVPRACDIFPKPPYSLAAEGSFDVVGPLNFGYEVTMGGIRRPALDFPLSTPLPGNPTLGRQTVTFPPAYLTGPNTSVVIRGFDVGNPTDQFECFSNLQAGTPSLSVNKSEAKCAEQVTFTAKDLYVAGTFSIVMECTSTNPGTPGYTDCTAGEKYTFNIPDGTGNSTYTLTQAFNINGKCGTGYSAKAGLYRLKLINSDGFVAPSQPYLRLTESGEACSISGQQNVVIFNGVPQNEVPFTLTAQPGTSWGVSINGTFLKSVTIPTGGTENVVIPTSYIETTLGTSGNAKNDIYVRQDGSGTQPDCEGYFLSYSIADWDCGYIEETPPNYNCSICGPDRICTTAGKCVVDTANVCDGLNNPPSEVCNMTDPCGSCPKKGEVCAEHPGTGTFYCKVDLQNTCGELLTYDIIPPLTGNFGTFEDFLKAFRGILVPLGIILGVLFIIICGYKFMTSQGQPDKLRDAKECLTSAIIGLLVVAMSVSILNTLINLAFKLL